MELSKIPIKYQQDIQIAYSILLAEGCKSVYLLGSLLTGNYDEFSDIDLGITGLPPEKFYKVYSKLELAMKTNVDLIDFDESKDMFNLLSEIGEVEEIGQ